jgi:hypothetical protein
LIPIEATINKVIAAAAVVKSIAANTSAMLIFLFFVVAKLPIHY